MVTENNNQLLELRRLPRLIFLALGAIAACGKSGIPEEVVHFKNAGHVTSEFAAVDASRLGAKECRSGNVDRLEVLLCEYAGPEAATLGQTAAEAWLDGSSTGIILRRGGLLLAAADRNHIDPNGKAISALAKVFRHPGGR